MNTYITTCTNFSSAHFLSMEEISEKDNIKIYGKCCNLHGHNYKLKVTISGKVGANGMVVNFKELKKVIDTEIIQKFDHAFLNDIMKAVPTAENMCQMFWEILDDRFKDKNVSLYEIRLYETDNSYVTLRREK